MQSKYKYSGEVWLGDIPNHWNKTSLKYISKISKGKKPSEDFQDFQDGMIPYLSMDFLRNKIENPTYVYPSDSNIEIVNQDDILILWDGSKAGEIVAAKNGALSSTMGKIQLTQSNICRDFIKWYLVHAQIHIQNNTVGMGIPHVDGNLLRSLLILNPPSNEQLQIAEYLDYQTNVIDQLIEKKENLVALLEEQRQAVINEAVTKGLDPNAKMKDSGIEWLGEIPEDWEVKKLKYFATIHNGKDWKKNAVESGGYPVYGTGGEMGRADYYLHKGPSVLLGRKGTINKPQFIDHPFWSVDTAFFTTIKNGIEPFFFFLLCQQIHFDRYQESSAVPSMTQEKLNNIYLPLPPNSVQIDILEKINLETKTLDQVLKFLGDQLNNLKEYRQSIISEAVTGKIDLREWKKPNKEQV